MLAPLFTAVQTLTRIPAPSYAPEPRRLAWSAVFYPVVGALLGLVAVGVHRMLFPALPRGVVMLSILALWVLLTGALHEDGLADAADAFCSQREREDLLRVLKDSHIGSYGTLALIFSVVVRWQALALMPLPLTDLALMASQILPRAGVVLLAWLAGPASGGSGGMLARSLRPPQVLLGWLVAFALLTPWEWRLAAPAATICLGIVALLAVYFRRKLGGVTGDCLGAASQLQEIAVVAFFLVAPEV